MISKLIDKIEICRLYEEGYYIKDLAEKYNISKSTVRNILVSNNITLRNRWDQPITKKKKKIDLLKALGFNEFPYGG